MNTERIILEGARTRVISVPGEPPSRDYVLQAPAADGAGWVDVRRTNDMSNDFALVDIRRWQRGLEDRLADAAESAANAAGAK